MSSFSKTPDSPMSYNLSARLAHENGSFPIRNNPLPNLPYSLQFFTI
jgi:hypothetical protein